MEPAVTPNAPGKPAPSSLCVVLPAYNEEENIGLLLDRIDEALGAGPLPYRILVVNDGSQDHTGEIVDKRSQRLPVCVLTHPVNAGLGVTIRDGLIEAATSCEESSVIITMDSDESHDPKLIPVMVEQIRAGSDVVIASRYRPGAAILGLSAFRKLLSIGASYLMRVTNPVPGVRDYTCGFRAYRSATIRTAMAAYGPDFITAQGFHCMAEILLKLHKLNCTFSEAPMILRYDLKKGQSKMRMLKTIRNTLRLALGSAARR